MKTVVGLYDAAQTAERVVEDLIREGFRREDISITARSSEAGESADTHTGTEAGSGAGTGATIGTAIGGVGGLLAGLGVLAIPGFGPIVAAGPLVAAITGAGIGAAAGGLVGGLIGLGIPRDEADVYAEGVRRGGYLVIVNAADEDADRAADVLDRYDPIDVDERAAAWRDEGWERPGTPTPSPASIEAGASRDAVLNEQRRMAGTQPLGETLTAAHAGAADTGTATGAGRPGRSEEYIAPAATGERTAAGEETIPIVEERLAVGKRSEARPVRVRSYVVERPAEAEVTLRDETVHVERRPADRPAATDADFRERVVEVAEVHEEAVVGKERRVVEEVVIGKDVTEHEERVSDTVRRTEVEVETDRERRREPAVTER